MKREMVWDFIKLVLRKLYYIMRKIKRLKLKDLMAKRINLKNISFNINSKKLKTLGGITLGCILMGLIFGHILGSFITPENQSSDHRVMANNNMETLYVIYLGTHETHEEVLTIEGQIRKLGYGIGIHLNEEGYTVFSHIVGNHSQLGEVVETLTEIEIEHTVDRIEVIVDDFKWNYFLKAVHQVHYELEQEFIEKFEQDEMFILGYYMTLATDSLDVLSIERQQMLREIYQWLNNQE